MSSALILDLIEIVLSLSVGTVFGMLLGAFLDHKDVLYVCPRCKAIGGRKPNVLEECKDDFNRLSETLKQSEEEDLQYRDRIKDVEDRHRNRSREIEAADVDADLSILDELHELLDCVESDMSLNGIDEFNRDSLSSLGQTLYDVLLHGNAATVRLKNANDSLTRLRAEVVTLTAQRNAAQEQHTDGLLFGDLHSRVQHQLGATKEAMARERNLSEGL